jgi:caa(3)-type oxidase subunit IV
MSHAAHADVPHGSHGAHAGAHHGPDHYVKIWAILCALLVVSIIGPMFHMKLLTLITAFGIAIIKAWMVASYFMHLNIEKKFASILLVTMIGALVVFWYGISPDIRMHQGTNWENTSAQAHAALHSEEGEGEGEAAPAEGQPETPPDGGSSEAHP